jgi:hypothetical protein
MIVIKLISGPTPIVRVMRQVLHNKKKEIEERKLLILLATDGAPTDDKGHLKINELRHVLEYERKPKDRIPVTIIACTGEYQRFQFNELNLIEEKIQTLLNYFFSKMIMIVCHI